MNKPQTALAAGAALALLVAIPATAQQSGTTSGPAAGTTVQPSTGVGGSSSSADQNQNQGSATERFKQGAMGNGAPGIAAKPGTESGAAPTQGSATERFKQGAMGNGAPGIAAKPGTESGAAPTQGSSQ